MHWRRVDCVRFFRHVRSKTGWQEKEVETNGLSRTIEGKETSVSCDYWSSLRVLIQWFELKFEYLKESWSCRHRSSSVASRYQLDFSFKKCLIGKLRRLLLHERMKVLVLASSDRLVEKIYSSFFTSGGRLRTIRVHSLNFTRKLRTT